MWFWPLFLVNHLYQIDLDAWPYIVLPFCLVQACAYDMRLLPNKSSKQLQVWFFLICFVIFASVNFSVGCWIMIEGIVDRWLGHCNEDIYCHLPVAVDAGALDWANGVVRWGPLYWNIYSLYWKVLLRSTKFLYVNLFLYLFYYTKHSAIIPLDVAVLVPIMMTI